MAVDEDTPMANDSAAPPSHIDSTSPSDSDSDSGSDSDSDASVSKKQKKKQGSPQQQQQQQQQVEWLATTRARRSTAGNRMQAMLANEEPADEDSDLELLFAEVGDDAGFTEVSDAASDVQMDSSSDDEDDADGNADAADDLAGEKELEKEARERKLAARKRKAQEIIPAKFRKKAKKVRIEPSAAGSTASTPAPASTPVAPRLKKKSDRASWLPSPSDMPTRASERQTTRLSKEQLHQQMVEREKKRKRQMEIMEKKAKRLEALKKPPMTQAERLAEAAVVEKRNSKSLNRWEEAEKQREEERRAKLAALHNRTLDGPVVTFWSGVVEYVEGKMKSAGKIVSMEEKAPRKKRQSAAAAATAAQEPPDKAAEEPTAETPAKTTGKTSTDPPSAQDADPSQPAAPESPVSPGKSEVPNPTEPPTLTEDPTPAEGTPAPMAPPPLPPPPEHKSPQSGLALPAGPRPPSDMPSDMQSPPPLLASPVGTVSNSKFVPSSVLAPPVGATANMLDGSAPIPSFSAAPGGKPNGLQHPGASRQSPLGMPPATPSKPEPASTPSIQSPTSTSHSQKPVSKRSPKIPVAEKEKAQAAPERPADGKITRKCIILQNFDENLIKDRTVQTQVLFGRKMSKLGKPGHAPLCVITNQPARYRDPKTGLPYYNAYAYREIQRLRRGDYKWSRLTGAWVGSGTFAAKGVPDRFLTGGPPRPPKVKAEDTASKPGPAAADTAAAAEEGEMVEEGQGDAENGDVPGPAVVDNATPVEGSVAQAGAA